MVNPPKASQPTPNNREDAAEAPPFSIADDLLWGAEAIGREINRSETQVYTMYAAGLLEGAVRKLSHRRFVGSRSGLRRLLTSAE
jgi:hypothetical protein